MDELKDVAKSLRRLPVVEPQLPTVRPAVLLLCCAALHGAAATCKLAAVKNSCLKDDSAGLASCWAA